MEEGEGKERRDYDVHRASRARRPKKRTVSRKHVAHDIEEGKEDEKEKVVVWKDIEKQREGRSEWRRQEQQRRTRREERRGEEIEALAPDIRSI